MSAASLKGKLVCLSPLEEELFMSPLLGEVTMYPLGEEFMPSLDFLELSHQPLILDILLYDECLQSRKEQED